MNPANASAGSCSFCWRSVENLQTCSRCRAKYYCSVTCQRSDWPQPKAICSNPRLTTLKQRVDEVFCQNMIQGIISALLYYVNNRENNPCNYLMLWFVINTDDKYEMILKPTNRPSEEEPKLGDTIQHDPHDTHFYAIVLANNENEINDVSLFIQKGMEKEKARANYEIIKHDMELFTILENKTFVASITQNSADFTFVFYEEESEAVLMEFKIPS